MDQVVESMPEGSVFWDFCKYHQQAATEDHGWRWKQTKYMALALSRDGTIEYADLGNAAPIDSLIDVHQRIMLKAPSTINRDGEESAVTELSSITDKLYERIVKPIEHTAQGCQHVVISPDAALHLLPFEMLTTSEGYFIEQYTLSYVSSGRDLLEEGGSRLIAEDRALVFTSPDYDSQPAGRKAVVLAELDVPPTGIVTRGPSDRTDCLAVPFDPLPATQIEGEAISGLLARGSHMTVDEYSGPSASESTIKSFTLPPRVLHIATHGYFCPKAWFSDSAPTTENPMLYSGLVLAGANRLITEEAEGLSDGEDGILTSLEASSLNLVGTELVVLSACRSGAGESRDAEGVFGLRRAFQHAGAQSVVMSLFDVPDKTTTELMNRFYANWISGSSMPAALRQASLELLAERRETNDGVAHPLFWGGFIIVGDPN
jgi:CHAT domain-containing protein